MVKIPPGHHPGEKERQAEVGLDGPQEPVTPGCPGRPDEAQGGGPAPCGGGYERALLVPYSLSTCDEEDAVAFEAHLLGCEGCFQDLMCLDRAGLLLSEFAASASPVVLDRIRHALFSRSSNVEAQASNPEPE